MCFQSLFFQEGAFKKLLLFTNTIIHKRKVILVQKKRVKSQNKGLPSQSNECSLCVTKELKGTLLVAKMVFC